MERRKKRVFRRTTGPVGTRYGQRQACSFEAGNTATHVARQVCSVGVGVCLTTYSSTVHQACLLLPKCRSPPLHDARGQDQGRRQVRMGEVETDKSERGRRDDGGELTYMYNSREAAEATT